MGLFNWNRNKRQAGFDMPVMKLMTDIHSHLLPGIDDGAKTIDESLEMIRAFIDLGYEKLIVTPHVHAKYRNTSNDIKNAYDALIKEVKAKNLNIELQYAAEYNLDSEFLKLIRNDDILSFSDFNYVLVEFPFKMPPLGIDMVYNMLKEKSYNPVIAHPERCDYWVGNKGMYQRLKDMGYMFQCDIHSAAGAYGPNAQRTFAMMADNAWIDFLGSDAHTVDTVKMISSSITISSVQKAILSGVKNHHV